MAFFPEFDPNLGLDNYKLPPRAAWTLVAFTVVWCGVLLFTAMHS